MADGFTDILIKIVGDASQYNTTMNNVKNKTKDMSNSVSNSMNNVGKSVTNNNTKSTTSFGHLIDFEKSSKNQLGNLSTEISNQGGRWSQLSSRMISAVQPMNARIYETGNRIKQTGEKIKNKLGTEAALAFAAAGAAALSFGKQCVSSAMAAESAWARFGGLVDSNGGDWASQKKEIKEWAVNFSNSMGYATSDTREAASALLAYGMSIEEVKAGMSGVAGLAARAGISEAEASNVVISALNGRANALRRYTGLEIDNYKAVDGSIDKQRLLSDIYEKSADALANHANTTEANINRMTNMWNSFKSEIGAALLPVVRIVADVVTGIVKVFKMLPAPVKTVIATLLLIGGAVATVIGVLGFMAPAIIGVGTLMVEFAKFGGIAGLLLRVAGYVKLFVAALASDFAALGSFLVSPWGLAIVAVVAVVAILWHLYNTNENVRNSLNNLGAVITGVLGNAWNTLVAGATQVWKWLTQLGEIVTGMLIPVWNELVVQVQPLYNAFVQLGSKLNELWIALNGGSGAVAVGATNFSIIGTVVQIITTQLLSFIQIVIILAQTAMAILIPALTFIVNQLSAWISAGTAVANVINDLVNGNISFGEALGKIGGIIANLGSDISSNLVQLFNDVASNLGGVFNSLPSIIQTELGNIAQAFLNASPILSAILSLGTQIVDFFKGILGIASPGFMAQAIQEEMGHIAEFITGAVGTIIGAITQLGLGILNAFLSIPALISAQFMQIVNTITLWFNQAKIQAVTIVGSMVNGVIARIFGFVNLIRLYLMAYVNVILLRFSQARTIASTLVSNMRTAIVTKIQNIISRVQTFFSRIPSIIRSKLASAVSTARQKAQEIYNNIKNKIQAIPKAVGDEIGKIPGKISSGLASAASAALRGAQNIVANFLSGLQRHSPGKIQRETDAEFKSLPSIIKSQGIVAAKNAGSAAQNIVKNWNNNLPDVLNVPEVDLTTLKNNMVGNIGNFNALSLDVMEYENLASNLDLNVAGTDLNNPPMFKPNHTVNNQYYTTEGSTRTIIIEKMENRMEMANLTKAQSRKVLFDAVDGLYDGVIGNG